MPARLPLFPLDNVVLLPAGEVGLHVFEPRYRQLTEHVLAGERRMGMIAVRPEAAHAIAGDPPLYEIGCAGFVAEHQRLADGRFHILLRATERFRVLRELPNEPDRLYRIAEVEPLPEVIGDEAAAARAGERIAALLAAIAERAHAAARPPDAGALRRLGAAELAAAVTQSVRLPTQEKQSLLEARTVAERLEQLAASLDFHLAVLERRAAGGQETLH